MSQNNELKRIANALNDIADYLCEIREAMDRAHPHTREVLGETGPQVYRQVLVDGEWRSI